MAKKPTVSLDRVPPPPKDTTTDDQPSAKLAPRLSIQLTDDGSRIAWDRVRSSTVDQLKDLLSADAGPLKAPAVKSEEAVSPAMVGMLYGSVGTVFVAIAVRMGYPKDEALKMQFTPDERAALIEPTTKVLAKYTKSFGRWEDEILLAVAVGSVVSAKFSTLKKPGTVIEMVPKSSTGNEPESETPA